MLRPALAFLALLVITWLEFQYYPGHSYLASSTQLYVPMLEHLQTPAYLTRDLVATHPQFSHTIYDETALFLVRSVKLQLPAALFWQQFVSRLAGTIGMFLFARAAGTSRLWALLLTAVINLGTFLPGVSAWMIDREPTPQAIAIGFCFLAFGLLAKAHPLPAGFFAGIALLFDPITAAPFWSLVALLAVFNRDTRRPLRPLIPVFLVFALLLANLAQLQQGTPDSQGLSERLSEALLPIEQFRSPELWISHWQPGSIYLYIAIWIVIVWATTRMLPSFTRIVRWILLCVPACPLLAFPLSFVLLDHLRWAIVLRCRPLEWCVYLVASGWIALGTALWRALQMRAHREAAAWLIACLFLALVGRNHVPVGPPQTGGAQLANWAAANTWGGSMFAFPDGERAVYPGAFRAASLRAVWADWEGGRIISETVAVAPIWWQRWQQTMTGTLSGDRLQQMLALPIDYYVFRTQHTVETSLEGKAAPVPAIYSNPDFRVFEANTLRLIPGKLVIREANEANPNAISPASQLPR